MSEETIVKNCSPTLAGIKTGSLFNCEYDSREMLKAKIREFNRRFASKGLRFVPMRIGEKRALIYVFRPKRLKNDLLSAEVAEILAERGYACEGPEKCVAALGKRIREDEEFPHEIGLFLGYPPEDVRGFIENHAKESKLVGHWKVYGDAEKARLLFDRYNRCTSSYLRKLTQGSSLENLTVAG
ncbi:MAG: DUF3793 family protein [Ruminococcaceae bacterium]|nr:DUF3793 family protein [Oscillospiraceae bacterium]